MPSTSNSSRGQLAALDLLGVDVDQLDLGVVGDAAVEQRLVQALVGVGELDVLADDADPHVVVRVLDARHQALPAGEVAVVVREVEQLEHDVVEPLAAEHERHLVDGRDVARGDHLPGVDVAEEGDLLLHLLGQGAVDAAEQDVGRDADLAQLAHRVLGRLGLQLVGGGDVGHQREVDVDGVAAAELQAELADGLEEGQRLDVADRAADLDDDDVVLAGDPAHGLLDLVGDVGDDLHGLAEVVAAPLLVDDRLVDLAGGVVVALGGQGVGEALVVAEVEVGLGAVVGDEDLAVLVGGHGARVDVDVGVELHQRDREAARLEDRADRGRGHALAEGGDDAAGDEDVLGRHVFSPWSDDFQSDAVQDRSTRSRSSAVSTPGDPLLDQQHADRNAVLQRPELLQRFAPLERRRRQAGEPQQGLALVAVDAEVLQRGGALRAAADRGSASG